MISVSECTCLTYEVSCSKSVKSFEERLERNIVFTAESRIRLIPYLDDGHSLNGFEASWRQERFTFLSRDGEPLLTLGPALC